MKKRRKAIHNHLDLRRLIFIKRRKKRRKAKIKQFKKIKHKKEWMVT